SILWSYGWCGGRRLLAALEKTSWKSLYWAGSLRSTSSSSVSSGSGRVSCFSWISWSISQRLVIKVIAPGLAWFRWNPTGPIRHMLTAGNFEGHWMLVHLAGGLVAASRRPCSSLSIFRRLSLRSSCSVCLPKILRVLAVRSGLGSLITIVITGGCSWVRGGSVVGTGSMVRVGFVRVC